MKLAPNAKYNFFVAEIAKLKRPFVKWRGLLFRASPLQFAQATRLMDGIGSYRWGGRWCAPGVFPAVNTSTDPAIALAESGASFAYYNWAAGDVRPKIIVAASAKFSRIADLTSIGASWVNVKELMREDWHKSNAARYESLTQAFGRAAHDCGAEGLLVPSARIPSGVNLVYFPETLDKESEVKLMGRQEVERWIRKR